MERFIKGDVILYRIGHITDQKLKECMDGVCNIIQE